MSYKISELAEKANVTKRTIHFYISKGLLMPPDGTGVNSLYTDEHLKRILLIKKLQAEYLPLNKIREYILNNPCNDTEIEQNISENNDIKYKNSNDIYVKENICNIFELHCSLNNAEKYKYVIENVKKYVEKMLEN